MKRFLSFCTLVFALSLDCSAQSQLDQLLNKVENSSPPTTAQPATANGSQTTPPAGLSLPDAKIADGLKAALTKSTGTAVASTGKPDGYFKNEAIKILVPSHLETVAKGMRMLGMGAQVDDLELSMKIGRAS